MSLPFHVNRFGPRPLITETSRKVKERSVLKRVSQAAVGIGLVCLTQIAFSQLVAPPPESAENPITEEKRILGKILFWDEQLSSDDTVACGTWVLTS